MGFTYEFANKPAKACESYKQSLKSNGKHIKINPDATMVLPKGVKNYKDYIAGFNKRLKCP